VSRRPVTDPVALGGAARAERLMGLMERNIGYVPGFRRAHARGIGLRGHFVATPAAAELTTAEHLQGATIAVVARPA
jgi:catalase